MSASLAAPQPFNLRALAERYDAQGPQAYLTLYAALLDEGHFEALGRRHREIRAAMTDNSSRAALDTAMAKVMTAYEDAKVGPRARAVAIFAGPGGFLEAHSLQASLPTRLVYDSGPSVRPLARYADDNE